MLAKNAKQREMEEVKGGGQEKRKKNLKILQKTNTTEKQSKMKKLCELKKKNF